MPTYQVVRKHEVIEPIVLEEDAVMTMAEAAQTFVPPITIQAISGMLERGDLTEIVDPTAHKRQRRRLVLREEILARAEKR